MRIENLALTHRNCVENWFLICVFFDSDAQLSCLLMHVEWLWSFYKKLNEIQFSSSKNWENLTKVIEIFCEVLMKENGQKGSFQLLDLIIPELKSHVIPYKFKSSHWLKLQHSDWRANLAKDFFFTNEFSANGSTWIYKGSHDF